MVETYSQVPTGKIITRGEPTIKRERALSGKALPGMLVAFIGTDYTVQKCSEATPDPVGFLSFEDTNHNTRPETYDTLYESGDVATVVAGVGFEIYTLVTAGDTDAAVVPGTKLTSNNDGTLKVAGDTDRIIGIAQESATITAGETSRVHVMSMI